MITDFETVEIVLVQKLASGEPMVRKRAFKAVKDWLKDASRSSDFNEESITRLCKGLYYVMWMQDNMLLQEELADSAGQLINVFANESQSALYIKCFFTTISEEWPRVDRWRMDKYLMLIRRLVRAVFLRLRTHCWSQTICDLYMSSFKGTVISPRRSFSEGLKFHFASVYLDELDNAGGLSEEQICYFLMPYAELLSEKDITNYLFNSVLEEVFVSILHFFAEQLAVKDTVEVDDSRLGETSSTKDGLKFDYKAIGKILFDIGKKPAIKSERRKYLYNAVKKFKAAGMGKNPFVEVTDEDLHIKSAVPKKEIADAVSRILNDGCKTSIAKKKKQRKRCRIR